MQNIFLLENHHEAYTVWKKNHIVDSTLVHIDAHLDFNSDVSTGISIGNFLYFALKDKMFSTVFWIVPGTKDELFSSKHLLIHHLREVCGQGLPLKIKWEQNSFTTHFMNSNLIITTLEGIPNLIKESICLDIDVDYFVTRNLSFANPTTCITTRKKTAKLASFYNTLSEKIPSPQVITIAYSVEGGFTPIESKILGDRVAHMFGFQDNSFAQKEFAHRLFLKCKNAYRKKECKKAKHLFTQAKKLNPSLSTIYNTFGMTFIKAKKYARALKEFEMMRQMDPGNPLYLIGLGITNIYQRKIKQSIMIFESILKNDKLNKTAILYLVFLYFYTKKFEKVLKLVERYKKTQGKFMHAIYQRGANAAAHLSRAILYKRLYLLSLKHKDSSLPFGLELL